MGYFKVLVETLPEYLKSKLIDDSIIEVIEYLEINYEATFIQYVERLSTTSSLKNYIQQFKGESTNIKNPDYFILKN